MDAESKVHIQEKDYGTRQLKRRGILAGVAALVAGVAAKTSARPAEARHGPADATNALHVDVFNSATGATTLQRDVGLGTNPVFYVANNVSGNGVRGDSNNSHGIVGVSTSGTPGGNSGILGTANIGPGVTGAGGFSSVGVFGTSPNAGVYGTSNVRGVWGHTEAGTGASFYADGAGVGYFASVVDDAVFAETLNPAKFAGNFRGNVFVTGSLSVQGIKSAVVPAADGTTRRVYCEESTESFFSDYGEVTYQGGKADVRLDPTYASVVLNAGYYVFLTEYGDNHGLYVSSRTPTGFEVRAKDSPTASGTFSYRIVAKRKDVPSQRLARVELPPPTKPDHHVERPPMPVIPETPQRPAEPPQRPAR